MPFEVLVAAIGAVLATSVQGAICTVCRIRQGHPRPDAIQPDDIPVMFVVAILGAAATCTLYWAFL